MIGTLVKDTKHIYIVCQSTNFRGQINELVALVTMQFKLTPFSERCAFIFYNKGNFREQELY